MDPVTQGVLGAVVTQSQVKPKQLAQAACIGAIAGMAPDLDVLIRSATDPLLAIEFHRHFTHSLFFIPFGALICSLVLYPLLGKRWQLSFKYVYLWSFIGYATHALLDACTSYGTQLLWPFSSQRFAWDTISVVDPAFTLPVLILCFLACRRQSKRFIYASLAWMAIYMSIGHLQHDRAKALGWELVQERGHDVQRLEVKPSFGNLAVWKVIYETPTHFYVDAVKPGFSQSRTWTGDHIEKLDLNQHFPWLDQDSRQAQDIARFSWFSGDYVAVDPLNELQIVDVRYSLLPQDIKPIWGIKVSPHAATDEHVQYYTSREDSRQALSTLIEMMFE